MSGDPRFSDLFCEIGALVDEAREQRSECSTELLRELRSQTDAHPFNQVLLRVVGDGNDSESPERDYDLVLRFDEAGAFGFGRAVLDYREDCLDEFTISDFDSHLQNLLFVRRRRIPSHGYLNSMSWMR